MPGFSLSPEEERLAKDWWANENVPPSAIAQRLRRNKSTITRLLFKRKGTRKKRGPCCMLSEKQIDILVAKLKDLIVKANGRWEITAAKLKKSSRCKAGIYTISKALHACGIYFYAMRMQPVVER